MRRSQGVIVFAGFGLAVLAVAGLGLAALTGRTSETRLGGPRLDIAVRTAPERPVVAGAVMEVGALIDGYVHRPAPPVSPEVSTVADAYLPDDTDPWAVAPEPAPMVWPRSTPIASPEPPATTPQPYEGRPLSFGFDAPRPDYAAERAARAAQREQQLEATRSAEQSAAAAEIFY